MGSLDVNQASRNIFFGCPEQSKIGIDVALVKHISSILLQIRLEDVDETLVEFIFIFGLERRLATGNRITIDLKVAVKGAHRVADFFEGDGTDQGLLCWIQNKIFPSVSINGLPFLGLWITNRV